jgi:hypothetical protein
MLKKSLIALAVSAMSIASAMAATNTKVANGEWMRLTNASRDNRCVTLVDANSNDSNARLYGQAKLTTAAGAPTQQWKFVEDPSNAGHYAMVCMASPNGSVTLIGSSSTAETDARWGYDDENVHYTFTLNAATTEDALVLMNDNLGTVYAMNMAMSPKNYAMNNYKATDTTGSTLVINSDDATAGLQWYVIQNQYTGSTAERKGRILGLSESTANRLNFAAKSDTYTDSQLWTFLPDPENPGKVALVNKTLPILSVSAPTGSGTDAKFAINDYGYQYNLTLAETGVNSDDHQWYMLLPDGQTGQYLNSSGTLKGFDANLYSNDSYAEGANHLALIPVNDGSFNVTVSYVDATGATIKANETATVKYGHTYDYSAPVLSYFTAAEATVAHTFLTGDYAATYSYTLTSGAFHGVNSVLETTIAEPTEGQTAVLKDAAGQLISGKEGAAEGTPYYVWKYTSDGKWVNEATGAEYAATSEPAAVDDEDADDTATADVTAYNYVADVYFKVTYTAAYGTETQSVETFGKAGSNISAVEIEGYDTPSTPIVENLAENTNLTESVTYQKTTAISEITVDAAAAATTVYDLQGRRVARTLPGHIYIINGQKIRK